MNRLAESPFLTVGEAATLFRCDEATIRRMCREGYLPAVHFGRKWLIDASGNEQPHELRGMHPKTRRPR